MEARQILDQITQDPAAARDQMPHLEAAHLIEALHLASTDHARILICDALGTMHAEAAVDALLGCLDTAAARVRSSAVDALAKIGDPRAGQALLARFQLPDPDLGVRRMLIAALGAVRCYEAIPLLIEWLHNPDPSQRGGAAWSLGALGAEQALPDLEDAARRERVRYPAERMREAIRALRMRSSGEH